MLPRIASLFFLLLLANNLAILLTTLDVLTTLELKSLESPHANVDHKAASGELVHRTPVLAACTTSTSNEELVTHEAGAGGLASWDLDFSHDFALGRDAQDVGTAV